MEDRARANGPGHVEEQFGGVHTGDVQALGREAVADSSVAAGRVEDRVAPFEPEEGDDVGRVAVIQFISEVAGVEVEVVLAECFVEVETHRLSLRRTVRDTGRISKLALSAPVRCSL